MTAFDPKRTSGDNSASGAEVYNRVLSGDPVMAIFRKPKPGGISFVSCVPLAAFLH
jgi:hypothetical protein